MITCFVLLFNCTDGSQLIGVYCYTPNPDTTVTINGISGIEIYQIDLPNVSEGYFRHYLNTSVDADGALYYYEDEVAFIWSANIFDGRQEIASFTYSDGTAKHIIYDPVAQDALIDENDTVYEFIKN